MIRIASYVAADKKARDDAKQAKKEEARKYREEQARLRQAAADKQAAAEEAERQRLAQIEAEKKKVAKAELNLTKKERKKLRNAAKGHPRSSPRSTLLTFCFLDNKFWVPEDKQIEMMEHVEFLCQAFDSIKLAEINSKLSSLPGKFSPVQGLPLI